MSYISNPGGSGGITSPVTTDPLTFSGSVTFGKTGKTAVTISDSGAQNSGITFGSDTNIYRSAANTLKTDDAFYAVGVLTTEAHATIAESQAYQIQLGRDHASGALRPAIGFGTLGDTIIRRVAAGVVGYDANATLTAPTMTPGSGGTIMLANVTTAPSTNPVGGPILYAEAGALKCRGTSGTVVTICAA